MAFKRQMPAIVQQHTPAGMPVQGRICIHINGLGQRGHQLPQLSVTNTRKPVRAARAKNKRGQDDGNYLMVQHRPGKLIHALQINFRGCDR